MVVDSSDEEKQHRSVDHWHRKVKDQQVISFRQRQLEAIFRVRGRIDLATQERRDGFPNHPHEPDIVVYDQNSSYGVAAHEWTLARKRTAFQAFPMQILLELAEALRERLRIIGDGKSRRDPLRHTERLKEVSERIDLLELQLPPTTDPQLRHFLQRRSYSKALELLTM